MKRQVIYIPGLGDSHVTGQRLAITTWWLYGVQPHLFQVNWANAETYDAKFDRLLALIDQLSNKKVYLVGASAGAMVVVSALARRPTKISGVVCIAGVLHNFRSTPPTVDHGSSFAAASYQAGQAMSQLSSADKQKMMSVRGKCDPVVTPTTSIVEDATNKQIAVSGHAAVIAHQLVIGAPSWLRFLKKLG